MTGNYPLPPSYQKSPAHPLDYSNVSVAEAYKHYNRLARQLSPEQLQAFKINLIKPYRAKNALVGGGLLAGSLLLFGYSAYKTRRGDDFDNIPMPPPPSSDPIDSAPAPAAK